MRERVCNNCGGREYEVVGQNMLKCKFCGTLYVDEHGSKEEEVLIVGAYELLRSLNFEGAIDEFDKILSLYPYSFEAHFGKTLAKNKIVLFNSKRGVKKHPKFYGQVCGIKDDPDFLKAIEISPEETKKTYQEIADRIEKIKEKYSKIKEEKFDIIVCGAGDEQLENLKQNLEYQIYTPAQKEQEEQSFRALESAKAFVLFFEGSVEASTKILCERYLYLAKNQQKAKSSFIVVKNKESLLPKDFKFCKSVIDENSISFLQDLKTLLESEMKKTVNVVAKIESVKVEKVSPKKKEYVNLDTVSPTELGNYFIENLDLNEQTKIKWIFLSLKNGDFATANNLIAEELEKNEYNAEVLFAQALAKRQIKTEEEFFSSISNFQDREEIEKILRYSSKNFAEYFVDKFEILIESLDSVDYYNKYLIFLASYNSPNRENFIKSAENKAVETLDENLIGKVETCFKKEDIDRFINFYFLLAQSFSDEKGEVYYNKILDLDVGHKESNLAMFLKHLKTNDDKLNYQNRDEVENILKYFDANARVDFINSIILQILKVTYVNLEKVENQLDFYLSYLPENKQKNSLEKIYQTFAEQGFFKQAEKYISIIISKKKTAKLYWDLIKIKLHCKSDNDVITSNVKVMQMPEWVSLLELGSDEENEYYTSIVSKSNLFAGKKKEIENDLYDQVTILQKLDDFIARNDKILLELEKQDGFSALKGVQYYRLQLQPLKNYINKIKNAKNFDEYKEICDKLFLRLNALSLTLESSVSLIKINEKNDAMKNYYVAKDSQQTHQKEVKSIKNDVFLKRFIFIFLELFPLAFSSLLFILSLAVPKQVYLYFNQDFLIFLMIFGVLIALGNLIYYLIRKKKIFNKTKIALMVLSIIGFANMVLCGVAFSFFAPSVMLTNGDNLHKLLTNAKYANFVLEQDIDLKNWKAINFHGKINGNGHTISNIVLSSGGFFDKFSGTLENISFNFAEKEYQNVETFGAIAKNGSGELKNVSVNGNLTFIYNKNFVLGGFFANMTGGTIQNSTNNLKITVISSGNDFSLGGMVGKITSGKSKIKIVKNKDKSSLTINCQSVKELNVGGMIGLLERSNITFSQNMGLLNLAMIGNAESGNIGGFVGYGKSACENSYTFGQIDANNFNADLSIGGLYGTFDNVVDSIDHCYSSAIIISPQEKCGAIVGFLKGRVENSFCIEREIFGEKSGTWAGDFKCFVLTEEFYNADLGFDEKIWEISENNYPTLKH